MMSPYSTIRNSFPRRYAARRGLALAETLILLGILISVCVMLFPALLAIRESARRATCMTNLRQLGRATQQYAEGRGHLPASSGVTRGPDVKITAVDGWSWQVMILPYLGHDQLYRALGVPLGRLPGESSESKTHADAMATSLPELLCPSSGCSPFADGEAKRFAITNYKALGATHVESLSVASPHPVRPKYDIPPDPGQSSGSQPRSQHPDGACFPGSDLKLEEITKGISYTLFCVESIEPRRARWTVGAEATVVGLPPNVEFERDSEGGYVPKGHRQAMENRPEALSCYWTHHTYLDWDYDRQPYESAVDNQGMKYGPSSGHPGVINHLFADGRVGGLNRDIDVTVYMWLIFRD